MLLKESLGNYIEKLYYSTPISIYEGLFIFFCLGTIFLMFRKGFKKGVRLSLGLLACEYVLLIYCSTVFFRKTVETVGYNYIPFWSYTAIQGGRSDLIDVVLMNVVVFVPIGLLLGLAFCRLKLWMVVMMGIGVSLPIEVLQFVFKRGYAEVDDVMHNTLGCLLGFMLVEILKGMWKFCTFLFVTQCGRRSKNFEILESRY